MQNSVSTLLSIFIRRGMGILNGFVKHVQIKSHYKPNVDFFQVTNSMHTSFIL